MADRMERPTTPAEREKAWDYALGLIQVDGLTPSKEFLKLVEKEKRGEITTAEIKIALDRKYKMKERPSDA